MTEWFDSITDINKFLKWANKHSWIITVPFISKTIIDRNGKDD